jgi:hypothetical protein
MYCRLRYFPFDLFWFSSYFLTHFPRVYCFYSSLLLSALLHTVIRDSLIYRTGPGSSSRTFPFFVGAPTLCPPSLHWTIPQKNLSSFLSGTAVRTRLAFVNGRTRSRDNLQPLMVLLRLYYPHRHPSLTSATYIPCDVWDEPLVFISAISQTLNQYRE